MPLSWFKLAFTAALPFVEAVFGTKNFQAAGEAAFRGIAAEIDASLHRPDELRKISSTLKDKAPELVGAIAAGTPAAKLVDPAVMPPGSVPGEGESTQQQQPGGDQASRR